MNRRLSFIFFCFHTWPLLAQNPEKSPLESRFTGENIEQLAIKGNYLKIILNRHKEKTLQVIAKKPLLGSQQCIISLKEEKQILKIEVKEKKQTNSTRCRSSITAFLPQVEQVITIRGKEVHMDANEFMGDLDYKIESGHIKIKGRVRRIVGISRNASIEIDGLEKESHLTSESGAIQINYAKQAPGNSQSKIRTVSGKVQIYGAKGVCDIKTHSGAIKIHYAQAPRDGQINLQTVKADANLFFPKDTLLQTHFYSQSGSIFNELGDSKKTQFMVNFRSQQGYLTVNSLPHE